MDTKQIESLVHILDASGLQVMEIEESGLRVFLSKAAGTGAPVMTAAPAVQQAPAISPPVSAAPAPAAAPAATPDETDLPEWDDLLTVTAPLVGTFHGLSSTGTGKKDIAPGDKLKAGDKVCVIEAMKLMNDINMSEDGEIVQVLCSEGDMVEFGQILFRYKA